MPEILHDAEAHSKQRNALQKAKWAWNFAFPVLQSHRRC